MDSKIIIIGAGGHAKVIIDIIEKCGGGVLIEGLLDDSKEVRNKSFRI